MNGDLMSSTANAPANSRYHLSTHVNSVLLQASRAPVCITILTFTYVRGPFKII